MHSIDDIISALKLFVNSNPDKNPEGQAPFREKLCGLIGTALTIAAYLEAMILYQIPGIIEFGGPREAWLNGSSASHKIHFPHLGVVEVKYVIAVDFNRRSLGFKPWFIESLKEWSERRTDREIYSLYINGLSHNAISRHLKENYFKPLGHAQVSKRIKKITKKNLEDFRSRDISGLDCPVVFADALYQKMVVGKKSRGMAVIIVIGINRRGRRELLAVEVVPNESARAYGKVFTDLKSRGLRDPALVVSDNHGSIKKAISECFPDAVWQSCVVHHRRGVMKKLKGATRPERNEILAEVISIWEQPDYAAALRRVDEICARWGGKFPGMCAELLDGINDTMAFYAFPWIDPKLIRSSNEIEQLNGFVRMRTRKVRIFPSVESYKLLVVSYLLYRGEEWAQNVRTSPNSMSMLRKSHGEMLQKTESALQRALGLSSPLDGSPLLLPAPEVSQTDLPLPASPINADSSADDSVSKNSAQKQGVIYLPGHCVQFAKKNAVYSETTANELELSGTPQGVASVNTQSLGGKADFAVLMSTRGARFPVSAGQPAKVTVQFGFALGIDGDGNRSPLAVAATAKGSGELAAKLAGSLAERMPAGPRVAVADPFWEGMGPDAFPGWEALWVSDRDPAVEAALSLVPKKARPEWEGEFARLKDCGDAVEAAAVLSGVAGRLDRDYPDAADTLRECAPGMARGFALAGFGVSPSRLSSASKPSGILDDAVGAAKDLNPLDAGAGAMMVMGEILKGCAELAGLSRSYIKADYIRNASAALDSGSLDSVLDTVDVILGDSLPQLTAGLS